MPRGSLEYRGGDDPAAAVAAEGERLAHRVFVDGCGDGDAAVVAGRVERDEKRRPAVAQVGRERDLDRSRVVCRVGRRVGRRLRGRRAGQQELPQLGVPLGRVR